METADCLSRSGFEMTYLTPDHDGMITPYAVEVAVRPDTAFVSVMHVNNEIGTKTDLPPVACFICYTNALLHVDAAQSAAHVPLNASQHPVELLFLSAHKLYGPKEDYVGFNWFYRVTF